MVRFSCFLTPLHSHKSKKIVQQAGGTMQFNSLVASEVQAINLPVVPASLKADENNSLESQIEQITGKSLQEGCQDSFLKEQQDFLLKAKLRKSKSLGNIVGKEIGSSYGNMVLEDDLDKGFSFQNIHQLDMNKLDYTDSINLDEDDIDSRSKLQNQNHESNKFQLCNISLVEPVHHESLFLIGIVEPSDLNYNDDANGKFADPDSSGQISSGIRPIHAKSCSLTSLRVRTIGINDGSLNMDLMGSHSRSFENLYSSNGERVQSLGGDEATYSRLSLNRQKAASDAHYMSHESDLDEQGSTCHSELRGHFLSNNSFGCNELSDLDEQGSTCHSELRGHLLSNNSCGCNELSDPEKDVKYFIKKSSSENQLVDSKGSPCDADSGEKCFHPNYSVGYYDMDDQFRDGKYWYEENKCFSSISHATELVQPGTEGSATCNLKESSVQNWDEPTTREELNINRVAAWINQLDVKNHNIVEELGESSNSISDKEPAKRAGMTDSKKVDAKSSLGMVVAYNYISTLSPTSSTAQMANLGLVAIPVLSAFVSLRMLNMSGNGIVRITAGALPKGLHMLNLSKNNISVIEGLRELTRLRVLDLSYNKISRIGHGLASCSTLKELYLGGNKISEVEGLHRLLKLSILDLHSNRISTAKGLGQLAANYASLQAIYLEGNPAQKNVGDEQLKKYLLSLLPHLAYYNKQVIRARGSKEVANRPSRSFSSHQFDRSSRSERKESHHGSHGTGHRKSSYSQIMSGSALNSSIKSSKSKHRRPAPPGPKPTNHFPDAGRNLLGFQPGNSLRRIQSEGAL